MKTSHTASIERSTGHIRRILSRAMLAAAVASTLPLLGGCQCRETNHPATLKDDPQHAVAINAKLDEVQAKKTWTIDDERAFRINLGHLSPETRFASAIRLATLINSQTVKIVRPRTKNRPPPMCTCTPGSCDRMTTTPTPATPGPTTNIPPTAAPPATKVR